MKVETHEVGMEMKTRFTLPKETKLDRKTLELVAVRVSLAVNCKECLEHHGHAALESGADEQEISEALKVGMMVRAGAASITDRFLVQKAAMVGCNQFSEQVTDKCACN